MSIEGCGATRIVTNRYHPGDGPGAATEVVAGQHGADETVNGVPGDAHWAERRQVDVR